MFNVRKCNFLRILLGQRILRAGLPLLLVIYIVYALEAVIYISQQRKCLTPSVMVTVVDLLAPEIKTQEGN